MALALDELGLAQAFDAAYGSSAGTLNAMWLVSGRVRDGIPTWTDPALVGRLISRRRALRRAPVVDVRTLVEERYEQLSPGLFAAVLAGSTELHPVATDVETGQAVDLHADIRDAATLRLAIRASAALPLLAGPPVALNGRPDRRRALRGDPVPRGAGRRRDPRARPALAPRGGGGDRAVAGERGADRAAAAPAVARLETGFLTRVEREGADEALLARHVADPSLRPSILSIRPPAESVSPSRLERDIDVVRAGLEAGRAAAHAVLG
jgi:hypothetical protein